MFMGWLLGNGGSGAGGTPGANGTGGSFAIDISQRYYVAASPTPAWYGPAGGYGITQPNASSSYGTGPEPQPNWLMSGVFLPAGTKLKKIKGIVQSRCYFNIFYGRNGLNPI
ncbi:MAG: hypothetical protein U5K75_00225 [Ahrensia sp.]|nr:hypothetical protein [Ahrensia sp.]